MELRVRKVMQAASGGSHVTVYDAEVELGGVEVRIEVSGVEPKDAIESDVVAAGP